MRAKSCFSSILLGALVVLACAIVGGLVGGRLLTPDDAMGWDAIANMLGGLMVGAACGIIISLWMALARQKKSRLKN
jgi:membrane associated rhomboid family serine protease